MFITSSPIIISVSGSGSNHEQTFSSHISGAERRLNADICCGGVAYLLRPSDWTQVCSVRETCNLLKKTKKLASEEIVKIIDNKK